MQPTLRQEPRKFFMSLRDISFWIRSAQTDAHFEKLRGQHGSRKAFDLLYANEQDPFGSTRPYWRYQNLKYERLISFLPDRRYRNALDIGCGLGPFTRHLAPHADQVMGVDISEEAIHGARALSAGQPNLVFERRDVLSIGAMDQQFDLIALLDVLYYLSPLSADVLQAVALQIEALLAPGGVLLLANHFFFGFDSASQQTRRIHDEFCEYTSLCSSAEYRRPFFLASVFEHCPPSVPAT
jgi:SAM-dependent methyltransferase